MYENGHIQYVFDDMERFPKVNSVEDFNVWATYLINVYHDEVESIDKPIDKDEEFDLHLLRFQTETKQKLLGLIVKISC
jgi:guanylate kinase